MATIILVPDPTWKGTREAPLMVRSDAMRALYRAGSSVSEVALYYEVPYDRAYRAIQPPRKDKRSPHSTARKELTAERLTSLSKQKLIDITDIPSRHMVKGKLEPNSLFDRARYEAADAELTKRYGSGWLDEELAKSPYRSKKG